MGKSAKVHKRIPKKSSSTIASPSSSRSDAAQTAKKRSKLKNKTTLAQIPAAASAPADLGPGKKSTVLGDADYVSLLMGGRRKARDEALKLPQNST